MPGMSTTPPEGGGPSVPIPPGYQPGDYIPHADRTPEHPWAIAGQPDQTDQAPSGAPVDPYRALYGYDAPDRVTYASWFARVGASLIDSVLNSAVALPAIAGYVLLMRDTQTVVNEFGVQTVEFVEVSPVAIGLIIIGAVAGLVFAVWNTCLRQGRTGYTLGKSVLGIKLIGTSSNGPIGPGMSFVRQLAHVLDSFCCNIGYLWPIWDKQKQTFADKVMSTVVIVQAPLPKQ
jgi:uncharacterized RDD family membrane protein YckC